jgi:triacylglycerol lipase
MRLWSLAMTGINFPWLNGWRWPSLDSIHINMTSPKDEPPKPQGNPRRRRTNSSPTARNFDHDLKPSSGEKPIAAADIIHNLLQNPALYDPVRTPRYPIVLCHGMCFFRTLFVYFRSSMSTFRTLRVRRAGSSFVPQPADAVLV